MIKQRNLAFYATIPVNIVLILWVWIGRAFFGAGGWWILLFLFTVVPVLAVALTVTTILAFTQRQPAAAGRLTISQFWCLIGVWASMFLFGFFVVDFGDTKESERSAFTLFTGRAGLDTSNVLSVIFFFLTIVAYAGLLVLLITGQQGRRERKLQQQFDAGSGISPAWPTQPGWLPAAQPGAHSGWDSQGTPQPGWDNQGTPKPGRDNQGTPQPGLDNQGAPQPGLDSQHPWVGPNPSGAGGSSEPPPGPADHWPGRH